MGKAKIDKPARFCERILRRLQYNWMLCVEWQSLFFAPGAIDSASNIRRKKVKGEE